MIYMLFEPLNYKKKLPGPLYAFYNAGVSEPLGKIGIHTARSIEIVPRGGPPIKMGGPPLEFINIQPLKSRE